MGAGTKQNEPCGFAHAKSVQGMATVITLIISTTFPGSSLRLDLQRLSLQPLRQFRRQRIVQPGFYRSARLFSALVLHPAIDVQAERTTMTGRYMMPFTMALMMASAAPSSSQPPSYSIAPAEKPFLRQTPAKFCTADLSGHVILVAAPLQQMERKPIL